MRQAFEHIIRGLRPVLKPKLQHGSQRAFQRDGQTHSVEVGERRGSACIAQLQEVHRLMDSRPGPRRVAGEQFVQDNPHREQVGGRPNIGPGIELFGGHILQGAEHFTLFDAGGFHQLGDAKIEHGDLVLVAYDDIGGLDITVQNGAAILGGGVTQLERLQDSGGDGEGARDGQGKLTSLFELTKGRAFNKSGDQVETRKRIVIFEFAEVEKSHHPLFVSPNFVGKIESERSQHLRFLPESLPNVGGVLTLVQDGQRDVMSFKSVEGSPDRLESSDADAPFDFVATPFEKLSCVRQGIRHDEAVTPQMVLRFKGLAYS